MSESFLHQPIHGVFRSLAGRIGFFVAVATLTSALAVAFTSAYALRAFLRSKIEQRIPAAVTQVRERLDLWYAQRIFDIQVFARSATVVDGLSRLTRAGAAGRGVARDRAQVEQYLGYVLGSLPQYLAIFALDAEGRMLAAVGPVPELAAAARRRLAATRDARVSEAFLARDGSSLQAVSSPVQLHGQRNVSTLHAVLPLRAIEAQLESGPQAGVGRTLIFDTGGAFVTASRTLAPAARAMSPRLAGAQQGEVRDYVAPDGLRVVGSKLPFPRLGWILVVEEDYVTAFAPIASILGRTVALNLGIVGVLSALAFAVVQYLVRPLHALSDCAKRLRDGEQNVRLPEVSSQDEVGILTRSFGEMVDSLARARERLEELAITDGLTKIHNHRFFQDRLVKEVERAERTAAPLALVLVDIDDFKTLNDRFGHAVGDGVLEQLANRLVAETRSRDLVARYGGEEFAILAPDTDREGALRLAEQVRLAVCERKFRVSPAKQPIHCTVSLGVAIYHGDREAFFLEADGALYAAKGAGKDCVMVADRVAQRAPSSST